MDLSSLPCNSPLLTGSTLHAVVRNTVLNFFLRRHPTLQDISSHSVKFTHTPVAFHYATPPHLSPSPGVSLSIIAHPSIVPLLQLTRVHSVSDSSTIGQTPLPYTTAVHINYHVQHTILLRHCCCLPTLSETPCATVLNRGLLQLLFKSHTDPCTPQISLTM